MAKRPQTPQTSGEPAAERGFRLRRSPRPAFLSRRQRPAKERRNRVNPLNPANIVSIVRVLATVPLTMLILANTAAGFFWAFWLFIVMAITDTVDGRLARRFGWVSNIGIFLDLTADKIYTAAILVALVEVDSMGAWPAIIILVREFVVTGLRSFAAAEGHVIPAGRWGKLKMLVTIIAIAWVCVDANVVRDGWFTWFGGWFAWLASLAPVVLWAAVGLTILSGLEYVWGARGLFERPSTDAAE